MLNGWLFCERLPALPLCWNLAGRSERAIEGRKQLQPYKCWHTFQSTFASILILLGFLERLWTLNSLPLFSERELITDGTLRYLLMLLEVILKSNFVCFV